ncbi:MAG: RNA polymerase subunit sigma [Cyanobacteriota bacterium]
MVGQFYLPGLAHQQARRFASRHGLAYEDVLGAAYEGLCKAVLGVDPALGHRPSSSVVPKVKGELLHHLRDTGFALRICHRYRELWIKALRVPVGVWVDVRLACGSPPVPLCQLHSQGLVEKTAAVECLSGREC